MSEVRYRRSDVGGRKYQRIRSFTLESKRINSAKELRVYKAAYALAMEIFSVSKKWPKEERYSLTDQIRRSSRSVCANLSEAWAKRRYEAHFISKLTDSDAENSETSTWLDFAMDAGYLTDQEYKELNINCRTAGAMLGSMIKKPAPFLLKLKSDV